MTPARKMQILFAACALAASGLVAHEGWETHSYPDPVLGNKRPTACAGVTDGVLPDHQYTEAECVRMTLVAMVENAAPIADCFPEDATPDDGLFVAEMVDMAHNIGGAGAFAKSTMCRRMKVHDYRGACDAILLYYWSQGHDCRTDKVCRGLWPRRQESHAKCLKALAQ